MCVWVNLTKSIPDMRCALVVTDLLQTPHSLMPFFGAVSRLPIAGYSNLSLLQRRFIKLLRTMLRRQEPLTAWCGTLACCRQRFDTSYRYWRALLNRRAEVSLALLCRNERCGLRFQYMALLLLCMVEPHDDDLVPAREYVAFLRDSVLRKHLGPGAQRQPALQDRGHSRRSSASSKHRRSLSRRSSASVSSASTASRSSRRSKSRRRKQGRKSKHRNQNNEESIFELFNKRMGEEIPDSSAGEPSHSYAGSRASSRSRATSGSESSSNSGTDEEEVSTHATTEDGTEYGTEATGSETAATSPTSQFDEYGSGTGGESLMEEEDVESTSEEEEEEEDDNTQSGNGTESLMEEETIYESDSNDDDGAVDESMY